MTNRNVNKADFEHQNLVVTERCRSDASLLARANGLPLSRVLALAMSEASLYHSGFTFCGELSHEYDLPQDMQTELTLWREFVSLAQHFHSQAEVYPNLVDTITGTSRQGSAALIKAIFEVRYFGSFSKIRGSSFITLRECMESLSHYFLLLNGDGGGKLLNNRSPDIQSFLNDFFHVCGVHVSEDEIDECWTAAKLDSSTLSAKESRFWPTLTRREKAELKAWRAAAFDKLHADDQAIENKGAT